MLSHVDAFKRISKQAVLCRWKLYILDGFLVLILCVFYLILSADLSRLGQTYIVSFVFSVPHYVQR